MSGLTYAQLVRELFPRLTGGIRWGLDRTRNLLASVGDPHRSYAVLHIGGTNGKGSVAAMAANALSRSGRRTGLYTSPHLCSFRERIQVEGAPIGEDALLDAAGALWPAIQREQPTFFEATTAIAFLALARAGVAAAVVEVGLGGRLDATNVVEPEVVALTNVSLDHVQLLGDSVAAVAREKAGIIKAGRPAVTAETDAVPLGIFEARAREVDAPLHVLRPGHIADLRTGVQGTSLRVHGADGAWVELSTPLIGEHQATNAALAFRALELLPPSLRPSSEEVRSGFAAVRWPGRLQMEVAYGRTWLFDVAHNVAAVHALARAIAALPLPQPLVVLVGVLGDKDWRTMIGPLHALSDAMVLTLPPTAPEDRRWDPAAVLREVPMPSARVVPDFGRALDVAWELAAAEGTVLVTGSFHTVGDALIALRMSPSGGDVSLPQPAFTTLPPAASAV